MSDVNCHNSTNKNTKETQKEMKRIEEEGGDTIF